MAVEKYTPAFQAQPFKQVKPTDSNDEYAAIKNAFDAMDAWSVETASMQIGTNRNILVDPSGVAGTGNAIVIMLPESPAVGDPPCRVALLYDSYAPAATSTHTAVYVQGDSVSGDMIMGTVNSLPRMYNAGSFMEFVWIGGDTGWLISACEIGVYATGGNFTNDGPNTTNAEKFIAPYMESFYTAAAFSPALSMTNPPRFVGQWCAFSFNAGMGVLVGDTHDTVNGAAAPVLVSTTYHRYVCICLGPNGGGGHDFAVV